jgi:hypothetical protein
MIRKRTNRSAKTAIPIIDHAGKRVLFRSVEIINPATMNSQIKTGRIGGTMGGIPVKSQDMVGEIMTMRRTNFQDRYMLPTIRGINIGRKAGPKPRK